MLTRKGKSLKPNLKILIERLVQTFGYYICERTIPSIITYHSINKINQEYFMFYPVKFSKFSS